MRAAQALAALRAAPVCSFEEIVGPAPLLVLAPHPDDESLGCGGLIAAACARHHDVRVAVLTDGGGSHPNSPTWPRERLVRTRAAEAAAAVACLGLAADRLLFLGETDGAAPTEGAALDAAVQRLAEVLIRDRIGVVCASWTADPHGDHVAAARIAAGACRLVGARHLSYPVWAWTLADDTGVPDIAGRCLRLDIEPYRPAKRAAIAAHATQHAGLIRDDPDGFALPAEFLAEFDHATEPFIVEP